VAVDQRVKQLSPPIRDHVDPLPPAPLLSRKALDDFGEWSEDSGSLFGTLDDVVNGVSKRLLLKAAINVPTGPAHAGAPVKSNPI